MPAGIRSLASGAGALAARAAKRERIDHDDRWRHLDSLWADRAAAARRGLGPREVGAAVDVGDIAVLQDAGDLMVLANPLDLADVALRLAPNGGGYDVVRDRYGFREPLGTPLELTDDDSRAVTLPFAFPFYGQTHTQLFVNSDGNLTFGVADVASTERSVSRLLTGAPRIAPFFADLDPAVGGRVVTAGDAGRFSVTWCGVPAFGATAVATAQVTIFPDGAIEIQVSAQTTIRDAVIGLSPGATEEFAPVDLSGLGPIPGGARAVGERFISTSELNLAAVSRRFIATHADTFDNVTVFTDRNLMSGDSFALELTVANQIQGVGVPIFNVSAQFGSSGRLQSICNMDALGKYPADPLLRFLGANSTVSVLGQEFGHRWLAHARFRQPGAAPSSELLGRDGSHWSFFVDSDGSVMEGNDIEDLGGGAFRTVGAVERYSLLDQYFMGLVDRTEVPPFFFVRDVVNTTRTADSAPRVGVRFDGVRRDVTIDNVVAAMGARQPAAAASPRTLRQAFVYVTSAGRMPTQDDVIKLDRIRIAWEQFVSAATDFRLSVDTRLVIPPLPAPGL